ncbi:MAG: hypothetical protein COA78_02605 [Blastopirellula sp.]|nr:MAG: hypothetical protein COA78_02605 [Blastopirellula sp.]
MLTFSSLAYSADPSSVAIHSGMLHLRNAEPREWAEFSETADARLFEQIFQVDKEKLGAKEATGWTLRLRQQDIKQQWTVRFNDRAISTLIRDENDIVHFIEVPPTSVKQGTNRLTISTKEGVAADDILVGDITLYAKSKQELFSKVDIEVHLKMFDTKEYSPGRLTIVDENGSLFDTDAVSNDHMAVRPGVIYTSTGKAEFHLPKGKYTLYASRGFEYSVRKYSFECKDDEAQVLYLYLRREVPTPGYVACDTHTHTRTHSGHGDSTVEERMITLAGEGIELPITTDHNVVIDTRPWAEKMGVSQYFTPVMGDEVTTQTGHFNVFPFAEGAAPPNYKSSVWKETLDSIYGTPGVKIAILNHARDVHRGTKPFSPEYFNDVVGENLDGWDMRFNAMEVINSGATQTDIMRLFHDWMALLNRGYQVTPVGSSDSHDVTRYIVGQGRTYIRADDYVPGKINIDQAVENFVAGKVMVSYGLLAEMKINGKYSSGDLVKTNGEKLRIQVRVLGPHWVDASVVELYANGQLIRSEEITKRIDEKLDTYGSMKRSRAKNGVIHTANWEIDTPNHDVHLVAIARGPGVKGNYWKTAKPYQPLSPKFTAELIGCSGAAWVDADNNGKADAARVYAEKIVNESNNNLPKLLKQLSGFDQAIASQAAHLYQQKNGNLIDMKSLAAIDAASPQVKEGFLKYLNAWKETERARAGR